jgi:signal transduction histidine kinase
LRLLVQTGSTGLPEADLGRIFERFVKLDHHRAEGRPEGSGLGLPIARTLARRMGGELNAMNDDNGRLCFRLSLRIAQPI